MCGGRWSNRYADLATKRGVQGRCHGGWRGFSEYLWLQVMAATGDAWQLLEAELQIHFDPHSSTGGIWVFFF